MRRPTPLSDFPKRVDFYAREVHHIAHAKAIYDKMPRDIRGEFFTTLQYLTRSPNAYVAVFCYGDLRQTDTLNKRVIYSEHGVGMFYDTVHSSYAGSLASRDKVVLRLSPNKCHADKEKETLKGIPVEIVGVPKMDEWAEKRNRLITKRNANPEMKPVVALSFHWDCKVCPETRSAFPHFANAIEELSEHVELIGHGHPRILAELRPFYHELGIRIAADFPRVLRDADMYICDNSSTIFEFAYLNKPVVLLNNPSYRKDVEQPGNPRFWKYADIGPQVDKPEELVGAVFEAWNNFGHYLPRIQQATDEIFTYTDGKCAERAVDAIIRMLKTY